MPPSSSLNTPLFRALRIVARADSDPARQVLFANLMQARLGVRLAVRAHERLAGTWLSALLVSSYGLAYYLRIGVPAQHRVTLLAVAKHVNARRQVERVVEWVGREHCALVQTRVHATSAVGGLVALARGRARGAVRTVRVVRVLERRHGFLVACRGAAAIAWYGRMREAVNRLAPVAVLVSSDSNPEEVGFAAAAQALGVPRIFVSHAYPTPFAPALDFDLSILEGEAAVRARTRKGPIKGAVVFSGVEGDSEVLDVGRFARSAPVIGIFAPKALSWTTLAEVVTDCRTLFGATRIVIRWHPSRLDPARHLQKLGDVRDVEESPMGASLTDVARRCDWVIADQNSNVHLPVLKLGIPTIAIKQLGLYPESRADMYGFAAARVVFPPVQSLKDLRREALADFFGEGWAERFREFDASYLRAEVDVRADVSRAIWALVGSTPTGGVSRGATGD